MENKNNTDYNPTNANNAEAGNVKEIHEGGVRKETGIDSLRPEELMEKYIHADSTAEIKAMADKIIELDTDINVEGLAKAQNQFKKEKKKDKLRQSENDSQFEQPE